MIDCFDGAIVSWTMSTIPNAKLINTMLDQSDATLQERKTSSSYESRCVLWLGMNGLIEWIVIT